MGGYDEIADRYDDDFSGNLDIEEERIVAEMLLTAMFHHRSIRPGYSVFDVGCGTGLGYELWRRCAGAHPRWRYCGFDPSREMLKRAEKRTDDGGSVPVDLYQESFESLAEDGPHRFGHTPCDFLISLFALCYCMHPADTFFDELVCKHLLPGGVGFVITSTAHRLNSDRYGMARSGGEADVVPIGYSVEALSSMASSAGLEVARTWSLSGTLARMNHRLAAMECFALTGYVPRTDYYAIIFRRPAK